MKILGIESSCDETAASIIEGKKYGKKHKIKVLSNIISSQINIHKKYGGVIPEVAAREHVLNVIPVIDKALKKAKIKNPSIDIDAIAVTLGPGLITSLIVGIETAKVLSYTWNIPIIGINHIEGHIYANFISNRQKTTNSKQNISFPAIVLTVSGGHTMLALMTDHGKYKTIGETLDDAAGEAFDKAAQLLNLGYPGGPAISKKAEEYKNSKLKTKNSKLSLPRPMINKPGFNFSFSGLKTALLYAVKKDKNYKERIPEYAYEFEQAAVEVLVSKTIKAALKYKVNTVMLAGGVAANKELRKQLKVAVKKQVPSSKFQIPSIKYTTDNAPMIASAGYFHAIKKDFTPLNKLKVYPNKILK